MTQISDRLDLRFPDCLAEDFPRDVPTAVDTVESILAVIDGADFAPLIRRSPGLAGNDWSNYLRCSIARMVHASAAARRRGVRGGRALDYGAYFGNFSLMFRRLGFDVDAVDSFSTYERAFDATNALLEAEGVRRHDFAQVGYDLVGLEAGAYDLVLCMGVIEHVPDSPRFLLTALDRMLSPSGVLIMDTPNLVHLYNRQKFARGESVMPDLPTFYYGDPPFEGHHREYTPSELVWMLEQLGHEQISVVLFNYSTYGAGVIVGRDVYNHWAMVLNPGIRELILTASRRSPAGRQPSLPRRWQDVLEDPERFWQHACPAELRERSGEDQLATELMLERLQHEVNIRDEKLQTLQQQVLDEAQVRSALQEEINRRDRLLVQERVQLQGEIDRRDMLLADERARYAATVDARLRRRAAQVRRLVRGR